MPDLYQVTIADGLKTVAAAGTPEALTADASILATCLIFYGVKTRDANVPTNNTGDVFIRSDATNLAAGVRVPAAGSASITAPEGKYLKLSEVFVKVLNNGDGVQWASVK